MFRTKLSVDRHVQELFRKVKDENERTLRCYNIAKLYFQVEDYESARRYVSSYLEVKADQAGPHKLLGKIYEALGQKESALSQYKQSLELEPRQDDLVLKVCELLADMEIGHDINRVKYWVDRADERFPHHSVVFQLKEKLLTIDKPNNGGEDLEALIAAELSARPSDVNLRVKLLKYYADKSRLEDAYNHAVDVESTHTHRDSIAWYEALCDLLTKCKEGRQSEWTYWILYVSSLERYAALSLKEQGHVVKKTLAEAAQAVFNLDQALTEAKLQNFLNNAILAEHMFSHMWGQLHFHLACLLLRKTKREQGSWSDTGRLCAPLLLAAMHVQPIDPTATWASHLKEPTKSQIQQWQREAFYRCSQAGHVLQNYARDDLKRMMDKIDKFCVGSWRERFYLRIFVSKAHIGTSYFANHIAPNPPLRLCSTTELKMYDQVAEEVWPASLHHHVWLGIVNNRTNSRNILEDCGPRPHQYCHVFPTLQLSVFNLSQAAPDSLGQLDIDAFLNAAVLCASVVVEEQQRSGFLSPDRLPTLPADITNTLCTCNQEKWWSSAYKIYRKQAEICGDLGEIRQEIQRGLEVVRCIGNHGLHPAILVHLARIFHHRAKLLREKDKNHSDLPFLEARCELYWSAVVPLLERLLNNQSIRTTSTKMFDYQGKEMNNIELTNALEEGRLLLAQRYIRDKQHEQAIEALQALKCPEASFMQGEIYKSLADELMSTLPKESLTSAMRSQHIVMLSKARGCYYLTLDRLRSPGMNPKHPLNSELGTRIADIENDLKRIDPDEWQANRHECDVMSEESYTSAHSGDHQATQNSFTGVIGSTIHMLGTPQKTSAHRTPKQASTPCRLQHHDVLELTRKSAQQEARPSPERLDAQIRQLIHSKDNMIQTILEQNKILLEANKTLVESSKTMNEKIEELQRQFANFCKESSQQSSTKRNRARSTTSHNNIDEDVYVIGDEDYGDMNYSQQQTAPHQQQQQLPNLFLQQQRNPYSPLVYPQAAAAAAAAALQGYYPPAMPAYNDPHMSSLYGGPRVFQMPAYYPRPGLDPSLTGMPKMPDNVQGLFTNRMMNQLSDLMPQTTVPMPAQQQQQQQQPPLIQPPLAATQLAMHLQNFDVTRNDPPAKDTSISLAQQPTKDHPPSSRPPPVNVVITTSDTLPTGAPAVQQPLSVTIPPQYRAATSSSLGQSIATTGNTAAAPVAPHSYQISMPSAAMIPTTVNLPPLSTTITNTISATVAEQERNQCKNTSLRSNSSTHNYSGEGPEIEHDPLPDFVPVIPLPAEVQVTTGEENEEALFCARAKLYRWCDREWKERGVGNVKLLRNNEGKVRLVMRREQVLKICANHMLTKDMELTRVMNNENAWIWVANDFADEEVKLEKLCIKFKYVEEAQAFKEKFDIAKASSNVSPIKNQETNVASTKVETKNVKHEPSKSGTVLGGFTFTSEPIIQETPTLEIKKTEETAKPNPFADFSFTKASSTVTSNENTGQSSGTFSFLKNVTNEPRTSEPAKTTLRRPHAPATATVDTKNATGELRGTIKEDSGEAVFYVKRANLMRGNVGSGSWKNRGLGNVRILVDTKNGKPRLHVKRDESGKIFCNFGFTEKTQFSLLSGTDSVVTWCIPESAKTGKTENLACLFESAEMATQFQDVLGSIQRRMKNDRIMSDCMRHEGKILRLIEPTRTKEEKSLSEMFKPPSGSWECTSCYTRNDSNAQKCVACQEPAPSTNPPATVTSKPPAKNTNEPDLWNQFKPKPDSWECPSCYIRNSKDNCYCVACDTARDPSMPPKPKTSGFNLKETPRESTGFSFGIPKTETSTKEPNQSQTTSIIEPNKTLSFGIPQTVTKEAAAGGFTFKMANHENDKTSDAKPIFGTKISTSNANFVFGVQQRPVTPEANRTTSGVTFGSPGKSFDFQFSAKSPAKSPGGGQGDASEDEVAESEDVYFTPVIPLPDKIEVKTGEEDEEVVYAHRAKLFRYDSNTKEWKERGLGDIKILRNPETRKLRFLMRRDQTLKLCLNHLLNRELEIKPKDDKTWMWNAADYSEGDIEYLHLACRFKNSQIANEFKKHIDDALAEATTPPNQDTKKETNEKTTQDPAALQEVQVVYEVKATAEEKQAALKLKLPENFYAYKLKEDCPGCRGCREPETPLFQGETKKTDSHTPIVVTIAPPKLSLAKHPETTSATETTTTQPKTSAASVFGQPSEETNKFGSGSSKGFTFGPPSSDKTSMFSSSTTSQRKSIFDENMFVAENLSICSPSSKQTGVTEETSSNQERQPFGRIQTHFGTSSTSTGGQPSIFGSSVSSEISLFGGNATSAKATSEQAKEPETSLGSASSASTVQSSIFGTSASPGISLFGGNATSTKTSSELSKDTESTAPPPFENLFGGTAKSSTATPIFGSSATTHFGSTSFGGVASATGTGANSIFGGQSATHTFGSSNTLTNMFDNAGPKPTFAPRTSTIVSSEASKENEEASKKETSDDKNDVMLYLPVTSSVTFSQLAAQTPATTFKKDPNFSFAGAGQSVFERPVASPSVTKNSFGAKSPKATSKTEDGDNEDASENDDPNAEHDPHFEPIVPLPDAIEVRTGEEDEEKLFGERAKLYRYEAETKEWKERGTGEMKLLHHAAQGTYRLLLRREQVYKVVCNLLVTSELELRPLLSSDRAWMWAGYNHAEEPYAIEELAVKFKNPQLAIKFKEAVEKAREDVKERQASGQVVTITEVDANECYGEEQEEEEVDDEEEEEDEEDDEHSMIFAGGADLLVLQDNVWKPLGTGVLKIVYDSEIYGAKIIVEADDTGEILSNTVISMETTMEINQEACIWTAIDEVPNPPVRRSLKAVFAIPELAQDMYINFQDGQEYAKQADISEASYYDPRIE